MVKVFARCIDDKVLESIFGTKDLKLYLYGDVAVIARSEEDVNRMFYAVSLPKSIGIDRLKEFVCRKPSIVKTRLCGEDVVALLDVHSADFAHMIAMRILRSFTELSPFAIKRVDVWTSYRSSEDGGFVPRNAIVVAIDRRFMDIESVIKKIEELVNDMLSKLCGVHASRT